MKHAILLLGDEDSSVVKECNKILVTLASYDEGVIILYRFVCPSVRPSVCFCLMSVSDLLPLERNEIKQTIL
jgi:hypothetical protein